MDLLNIKSHDPFAETEEASATELIHIRVQQRNGRKTITSVQGLPNDLDQKRILKAFKKEFACNGHVVDDEDLGTVIQLQGDHRTKIFEFLVSNEIGQKDRIKVHGF